MTLQYEVRQRNGPTDVYNDPDDVADRITTDEDYIHNLEVDVDESLDEGYGYLEIRGRQYYASAILRALDEDEYTDAIDDEQRYCAESNEEYVSDQVGRMREGETLYFEGGFTVLCIGIPDDEDDDLAEFDKESFDSALR